MRPDRWVAIDFETATNEPASACALGLAVIEGSQIVETASWLIQPPANEYHWFCTRVHGITAEDTAQSPEFDEVWPEIASFLGEGRLLAHNAPFDARVLAALLDRYGFSPPAPLSIACTVAMSRVAFPWLPDHKLHTVCSEHDIELVHHDALSDALGCARIALCCSEQAGAATVTDTVRLLGVSLRRV